MNFRTFSGGSTEQYNGGLDSAVLVAESLRTRPIHPLYVRWGLYWERTELAHLRQFLDAIHGPGLAPAARANAEPGESFRESPDSRVRPCSRAR